MNRKSSAYVTLALIGVLSGAAVVGYRSGETRRDVYTSLDNCTQDWGDTSQCEPVRDGRYSAGSYYGPVRSGGSAAGAHALTSTHVSRGGFGSLGASHSSGS